MNPDTWKSAFARVRARTEALAAPLSPEDQLLQAHPECSPTKWHRAHTTWFFETFILVKAGIAPVDERWSFLFNSYYEGIGPRHARTRRGLLSRPSHDEIAAYRRTVDGRMMEHLDRVTPAGWPALAPLLALGLAHEEQHQELLLTDILAALYENPLRPAYLREGIIEDGPPAVAPTPSPIPAGSTPFLSFEGGMVEIGATGEGFCFDNEAPRHQRLLHPFALSDRLVNWGQVQAFCRDGGYRTASLWLSDGWDCVITSGCERPRPVVERDGTWEVFGVRGLRPCDPDAPATGLSYYEADAIARWLGARLPDEAEWEHAAGSGQPLLQLFDHAWQWTRSDYAPYPGFAPAAGAVGEYNGKFMVNQRVLRGSSAFTPPGHARLTYRNFWHPPTRFQMTGLRLARDL